MTVPGTGIDAETYPAGVALKAAVSVIRVLANEHRLKIFLILLVAKQAQAEITQEKCGPPKGLTVSELEKLLEIPQPQTSRLLSEMRTGNLVIGEQHYRNIFYRLADTPDGALAEVIVIKPPFVELANSAKESVLALLKARAAKPEGPPAS